MIKEGKVMMSRSKRRRRTVCSWSWSQDRCQRFCAIWTNGGSNFHQY